MFDPQRTPFLLASLLLALTLIACDTVAPTVPPTVAVTATPAATLPTAAQSGPTAPAPPRPTAAAIAVASPTISEGISPVAPTVAAHAPAATEQALAPEQNPPGDIPDTQAFVSYSSRVGGYTLDVPEGWARSENGPDVSFIEKLDGLRVTITDTATAAPTAATARAVQGRPWRKRGGRCR